MLLSSLSLWHIVVPTMGGSMSEGQWVDWMIDKDEGMSHQWPGKSWRVMLRIPAETAIHWWGVDLVCGTRIWSPFTAIKFLFGENHITLLYHRIRTWNFPGAVWGPGGSGVQVSGCWQCGGSFGFRCTFSSSQCPACSTGNCRSCGSLPCWWRNCPACQVKMGEGWLDGDFMKFLSWWDFGEFRVWDKPSQLRVLERWHWSTLFLSGNQEIATG